MYNMKVVLKLYYKWFKIKKIVKENKVYICVFFYVKIYFLMNYVKICFFDIKIKLFNL